jgi:glycosyltransferase involved in cell wall biosynthesis
MGGTTIRSKIGLLASLPGVIADLRKAMRVADAIHVRCPGNLGLLGALLAPLYSKCLIAKYAGQWNGYPGEAWTVRLQRALLRSRWWAGPVTVYGEWPGQPAQVVPFFTSMLADDQIRSIVERRRHRRNGVLRVLFVGRLSASKNVHVLVEAAAVLKSERIPISCSVVGEGPEQKRLEQLSRQLGVNDCVEFVGGVPLDRVLDFYAESDALVLPSQTEGWPKVVAEAMAFGLICIASDRGYVAQMLGEGRGILVPPGDTPAVARALREAALNPSLFESMRERASEWSCRYSLEGLRDALHKLLSERWGVALESSAVNAGSGSR